MTAKRALIILFAIGTGIAIGPHSATGATGMWEEDIRMICTDSGQTKLPKKFTIRQTIDESFFASAAQTNVVLFASYLFRLDVNSGKVIATGVLRKQDGSETALPRLTGKMKDGDVDKGKAVNVTFAPGDVIEWKVKTKGLKPLQGLDCWSLEVGITGADTMGALSRLKSMSAVTKTKP